LGVFGFFFCMCTYSKVHNPIAFVAMV